ncbi:hypothetical protein FFB58_15480 [Enterobacter sp. MF024]|uniref:hypothetical protein n=1 Tax=Enterobacter sp. MF024 TaxID=2555644 RepID=UPI001106B83E|nr:hypothetical protein [Enterobacter sp. MF024]TLU65896.1 hypothetical protein FFB58_15480 [Enterobacter sp. MF024]
MNENTKDLGIKEVRFYAVTGAKTKDNGIIIGTSSLTSYGKNTVLQNDIVTYPDGTTAFVMPDPTTRMTTVVNGKTLSAAASGTFISNGDVITDAGQTSIALVTFENNTCMCSVMDEEEYDELKARGVIR